MNVLCFSDQRWDHSSATRQLLPGYFRSKYRLLYVEPPESHGQDYFSRLDITPVFGEHGSAIQVVRLIVGRMLGGHTHLSDIHVQHVYARLLLRLMHNDAYVDPILWIRTNDALCFADLIPHQLLVVDQRYSVCGTNVRVEVLQPKVILITGKESTQTAHR